MGGCLCITVDAHDHGEGIEAEVLVIELSGSDGLGEGQGEEIRQRLYETLRREWSDEESHEEDAWSAGKGGIG